MRIVKVSFSNLRSSHFKFICMFVCLLAVSASQSVWAQEPLTLGVHPFLSYIEIEKNFGPLATYLSQELSRPVVVRVGSSYQEHIDTIGHDQLDIAYIGPAVYVALVEKYGPKPLIVCQETNGSPVFRGVIVVRGDYPATSLAELGEGELAFVDAHSTMGFLIPKLMLQQSAPHLIANQRYQFVGSHENVALGVLAGDFIAGAVKEAVYQKFKPRGLRTLVATPPIAEHLFVASNRLAEATVKQLRVAMLKLNQDKNNHKVLTSIKASITGVALTSDSAYDPLREMLNLKSEKGLK